MSAQTFKITADVTMNNTNVNISNLATIELPPKISSFTITPSDALARGNENAHYLRAKHNEEDALAQIARLRETPNSREFYIAEHNIVSQFLEQHRKSEENFKDIIYGEYFLIYDNLYMKKQFPAYIQFINGRWFFYFYFANTFYSFYKTINTDNFMNFNSLQDHFFDNHNLHIFNKITNTNIKPPSNNFNITTLVTTQPIR
jgi:hypothetical protein